MNECPTGDCDGHVDQTDCVCGEHVEVPCGTPEGVVFQCGACSRELVWVLGEHGFELVEDRGAR